MIASADAFDQLDADLESETHDPDRVAQYRQDYARSKDDDGTGHLGASDHPVNLRRGKLGFLLFTIDERNSNYKQAALYLKGVDTREYIRARYQVTTPIWSDATLELLRTGTTSYILTHATRVLKIIKPIFWNSKQIKKDNLAYKNTYGNLCGARITPEIHAVGELYIDMTLVPGRTLTEYFHDNIHSKNKKHGVELGIVEKIDVIFRRLCEHLQICSDKGLWHLDLSPENIIIDTDIDKKDVTAVTLIDFGRNYLLSERIGAAGRQWSRAQIFVAPEISSGLGAGSELSDVYSLGKILLEALSPRSLTIHELTRDLDAIWLECPEFAKLIDDMIAEEPDARLLNRDAGTPVFTYIGDVISEELTIYKNVRLRKVTGRREILDGMAHFLGPINALLDWGARLDELEKMNLSDGDGKRLLKCAYRVVWVHWAVLCTFFIALATFRDRRLCDVGHFCVAAINSPSPTPLSGFLFFSGFLPGRIVALSFSFVWVKYYWELFSTISVRGLKVPTSAGWAERFMRGILFLPFPTILYALIVDPKAWPFCSGVGLLWIGVNNHLMSALANRANEVLEKDLKTTESSLVTDKLLFFAGWPAMIYYYAIALLLLGVLLVTNVLKDEWFYGLIIVPIVNILKMYKENCSRDAPPLRSVLERLVAGLRRLARKTDARPA